MTISSVINSKNINLSLVENHDAEFIVRLRFRKGQFLSQTNSSVEDQIEWIRQYKEKEKNKEEYYFIIEDKDDNRIGTVRVYNISYREKSFTFGSFIIEKELSTKYCALEAMTLMLNFCFNSLKLEKCFFDCRINNHKANAFYIRYGAIELRRDDLDIYYEYDKHLFDQNCKKYFNIIDDHSISRSQTN